MADYFVDEASQEALTDMPPRSEEVCIHCSLWFDICIKFCMVLTVLYWTILFKDIGIVDWTVVYAVV